MLISLSTLETDRINTLTTRILSTGRDISPIKKSPKRERKYSADNFRRQFETSLNLLCYSTHCDDADFKFKR